MSVFLSHSRLDVAFVHKLAMQLIERNIKVWRDQWRLSPGDALDARIAEAIAQAKVFCIVLSRNALASEWVDKEIDLSLAATRERGLRILPLVIDDCQIPAILSNLLYVDFRESFEAGFDLLMKAIGRSYEATGRGSLRDDRYFTYWGMEQGLQDGHHLLDLEIVSLDLEEEYCIISDVTLLSEDAIEYDDSLGDALLRGLADAFRAEPARVPLRGAESQTARFTIEGQMATYQATLRTRALGEHRGSTLFNVGALFEQIERQLPPLERDDLERDDLERDDGADSCA